MRIPPDSEKSNLIRIEGDPQGVQQAKRELLELASRMVSAMSGASRKALALRLLAPSKEQRVVVCGLGEWKSTNPTLHWNRI